MKLLPTSIETMKAQARALRDLGAGSYNQNLQLLAEWVGMKNYETAETLLPQSERDVAAEYATITPDDDGFWQVRSGTYESFIGTDDWVMALAHGAWLLATDEVPASTIYGFFAGQHEAVVRILDQGSPWSFTLADLEAAAREVVGTTDGSESHQSKRHGFMLTAESYGRPWRKDTELSRSHQGDAVTNLDRRFVSHSPTGYEWGYMGSGPSDLAMNILGQAIPAFHDGRLPRELSGQGQYISETAGENYMVFRDEVLNKTPKEGGKVAWGTVSKFMDDAANRHRQDGPVMASLRTSTDTHYWAWPFPVGRQELQEELGVSCSG